MVQQVFEKTFLPSNMVHMVQQFGGSVCTKFEKTFSPSNMAQQVLNPTWSNKFLRKRFHHPTDIYDISYIHMFSYHMYIKIRSICSAISTHCDLIQILVHGSHSSTAQVLSMRRVHSLAQKMSTNEGVNWTSVDNLGILWHNLEIT